MEYDAYIKDGRPVHCSFDVNPSTLRDEINAFLFRVEKEVCIAAWKQLQDCGDNILKMEVQLNLPFMFNFIKEVKFESKEYKDVVDQIIRESARYLCQEIKKSLALQMIASCEFRELKITQD